MSGPGRRVTIAFDRGEHLDFAPGQPDRPVVLAFDDGRSGFGVSLTAREALARRADIERLGAGWFLPFVTAMAAGEAISADAVVAAFEARFGRPPLWDVGTKLERRQLHPSDVERVYSAREPRPRGATIDSDP